MPTTIFFTQAYNAQNLISRAIDSILNQTCKDFHYFILDNGSTDNTGSIINNYAQIDSRIIPLRINKNDITNGGPFWNMLVNATSAKYMAWIDADDEYTPDFLEKMLRFSKKNQLDIAACGYDKIDGVTNELIKQRALTKNLVIHDKLFTDKFVDYRGFMSSIWGKLFSVSFLRPKKQILDNGKVVIENSCGTETTEYNFFSDSIWLYDLFRKAKRVGVYGKAMYKYYRYPSSSFHNHLENVIGNYPTWYWATYNYLQSYGPISKINRDFLYAIHLSLVEDVVNDVFAAEAVTDVKLDLLIRIFSDPVWPETLSREADPQFRNLAARQEYVNSVRNKILALPGIEQTKVHRLLDLLIAKNQGG